MIPTIFSLHQAATMGTAAVVATKAPSKSKATSKGAPPENADPLQEELDNNGVAAAVPKATAHPQLPLLASSVTLVPMMSATFARSRSTIFSGAFA